LVKKLATAEVVTFFLGLEKLAEKLPRSERKITADEEIQAQIRNSYLERGISTKDWGKNNHVW